MEFGKTLTVAKTAIPGLLLLQLPVHGDNRGWFKENWQREKMVSLGLPDFTPVQNNISFNLHAGTTRGIHAEPWDKLVSVAHGRVFGAWVDLREGDGFGRTFTAELGPSTAVFVPYGVGNAFQTLEDNTAYSYLVNAHWSAGSQDRYTFLNLGDEAANIDWPIALEQAELSAKDKNHPRLYNVKPMLPRRILVTGSNGQVGSALRNHFAARPEVEFTDRSTLDLADQDSVLGRDWSGYSAIINAAAFTAVDDAEADAGRRKAWSVNVAGAAMLARVAREHQLILVHISSDYVFDGRTENHTEDEPFTPLGVYGQTKAAADAVVQSVPWHYILRTSWVVGDGPNFVRTMDALARRGVHPSVVNDQWGRLTFATDIARAIDHLLLSGAAFGTYNISSGGPVRTWADIARSVYAATHQEASSVIGVSTDVYTAGKHSAPRPRHSSLDLSKIEAIGFTPSDGDAALCQYLTGLPTS